MRSVIEYFRVRRSLIAFIFFSNYFYGICAVALSIEASLQQGFLLNSVWFYIFIFAVTVLHYTKAYYITEKKNIRANPRSDWYWEKRKHVFNSQMFLTAIVVVYLAILFFRHSWFITNLPLLNWVMVLIFPMVSVFYYGINHRKFSKYKLRNIGWLKPLIIGFVWAGLVTVYPILFYDIEHEVVYLPDWTGAFLFVKNFMFITVLCIMFDIKDYATDYNRQLKTFVVKAGLRKTIFVILIPLCVLGLTSFIIYAIARQFNFIRIFLNIIPFLLLISVAYSMHRRKSIFYYLIVIDGLMLVKAFCGITAMLV